MVKAKDPNNRSEHDHPGWNWRENREVDDPNYVSSRHQMAANAGETHFDASGHQGQEMFFVETHAPQEFLLGDVRVPRREIFPLSTKPETPEMGGAPDSARHIGAFLAKAP